MPFFQAIPNYPKFWKLGYILAVLHLW